MTIGAAQPFIPMARFLLVPQETRGYRSNIISLCKRILYTGGASLPLMTGGQAVVECIRRAGVSHAFCVPGESYLGVLDAFYDAAGITLVTNRHEEGAGFMADAYAKVTGKPGVCLATRGPGATHLSIALHVAMHDSTPMVAFIGQVNSDFLDRDAFQEVNMVDFFTPIVKWAVEIREVDRMAEQVQKAFHVATSGRPGPVVVSLPEDLLRVPVEMRFPEAAPTVLSRPPAAAVATAADLLLGARSAVILAGYGVQRSGANALLQELAETLGAGVFAAWRRYDVFPNQHPNYVGASHFSMPREYSAPLHDAEVILAVGTRLGDVTTDMFRVPGADQKLIHIDISPSVIGTNLPTTVGIAADAGLALADLLAAVRGQGDAGWLAERRAKTAAWRANLERLTQARPVQHAPVDPEGVVYDLRRLLPDNAAIVQDAGNHTGFFTRYFRFPQPGTYYGTTSGAMGYGVPGAIGVKIAKPEVPVICDVGDGGFAMTMSEIQTACRLGLKGLVFLVFNNSMYGTIGSHQAKHYPGRRVAIELGEADFATVGQGLGAYAERVTSNADFPAALERALNAGRPAVLELVTRRDRHGVWALE